MADDNAFDRCTISMDLVKLCGEPCIPDAPIPICFAHAGTLIQFVGATADQTIISDFWARAYGAASTSKRQQYARQAITESNAVVYYVRVGEMVKIGTTTQLKARMRAYPPGSRLLATEPGGPELERQRLDQFTDCLAAGNEWFVPTTRLMAHIEALRSAA